MATSSLYFSFCPLLCSPFMSCTWGSLQFIYHKISPCTSALATARFRHHPALPHPWGGGTLAAFGPPQKVSEKPFKKHPSANQMGVKHTGKEKRTSLHANTTRTTARQTHRDKSVHRQRLKSARRRRGHFFSLLSGTHGFKQHLRHILQLLAQFTASLFGAVLMGLDHNGLLTASISTINALSAQGAREEPTRPTFTGTRKPVNFWSQGTLGLSVVAVYMCGYGPESTLVIYWHLHLLSSSEEAICHYGNVNM
ncbi:hypothetical protein QQF64_005297 [Cirrhinus molitorella]|uniref:Uncharacterized protein n=1 Tax=Cirrhinus molitorella TaxID=172907 RepID=A0ABR3MBR1_9TELE